MLIEQRKSIGTADNVFTDLEDDGIYRPVMVVKGYQSHEDWAEITPSWRVYCRYDGNREECAGQGTSFEHALRLACGKPVTAGAWYAVQGHARNWAPKGWGQAMCDDTDLWMDEEMES
jgi:hypothetical protein